MRKLEHIIRERQILKPSRGSIKPGDKFNQLTVLRTNVDRRGGVYYHECQCNCGKVKLVRSNNVKTTLSCGCAHQGVNQGLKIILKPGDVYGRLTLVREADIKVGAYNKWDCICECGNEHTVSRQSLIRGTTRSCGCLRIENLKKLGLEKKMNNEQDKKAEEILDVMLAAPQGAQLSVNDFGQLTIDNGDGTGSILVNLMPMARQDGWSQANANGTSYKMKELYDKVREMCKDRNFKLVLPNGVHSIDDLLTRNCRTEISIRGMGDHEPMSDEELAERGRQIDSLPGKLKQRSPSQIAQEKRREAVLGSRREWLRKHVVTSPVPMRYRNVIGNIDHPLEFCFNDWFIDGNPDNLSISEAIARRLEMAYFEEHYLMISFREANRPMWGYPRFMAGIDHFRDHWDTKMIMAIQSRNDSSWEFFPEPEVPSRPCGFAWDSCDSSMSLLSVPIVPDSHVFRRKYFFSAEERVKQFPHMPKPHEVWAALPHHWRIRQYVKQSTR